MRKIKQNITYTVPSWNFCTLDTVQPDGRYSKELCRFCVKDKTGYRCLLYEERLATNPPFVCKTKQCIDASAGFKTDVVEAPPPTVVPKLIIRETLKNYKKTVDDLIKQGYPRNMAEAAAYEFMLK